MLFLSADGGGGDAPIAVPVHRQAFYENVVHGVIVRGTEGEREPLYTQVAVVPVEDGFESDTPMMTVTRTAQAVRSGISSALNGGHRSGDYADDSEALEEMVIDIDGDHGGTIRQTAIGGANDDNGYEPWPVWSAVNVSLERERTFPESSQTEWVEGVGVTSRRRRKIVGLITCQVISVKKIGGPMFFKLHCKSSFRPGL